MGVVDNITLKDFPKQSEYIGKKVRVCFHYDVDHTINGKIVRDDMVAPYKTIILLDDGRYVLGTECQYQIDFKRG